MAEWNFFTNYGHVVFLLSMHPEITLREIALKVGITERATQRLIGDLEKGGYIKITKVGRKNRYKVMDKKKLKHEVEKTCQLKDIIEVIQKKAVSK